MSNESIIQVFEGMNVRIIWNEQEEKYYFAVADIVQVLTDTTNPTDYLKKMRQRDKELSTSKKAEPVKQWLAEVGAQRIDHFSCLM